MKVYRRGVGSTGYQIKDVAERSGFTAATLRYYEEIGLLPQAARTPSGYRSYDDRTLDRLAFIARAKQLGCTLEEITELTTAWEGGSCGPIQDRLRSVVADKLRDAQSQIVELMTLTSELQAAAAALELHRPEGPCDDTCGCVTEPTPSVRSISIAMTAKPSATTEAPIACTLAPGQLRGRLEEWEALLAHASARGRFDGGVRLTFAPDAPLGELMRLVAAEQDCCQFFQFAITVDLRGIALEVTAPDEALPIVESLFGAAS